MKEREREEKRVIDRDRYIDREKDRESMFSTYGE